MTGSSALPSLVALACFALSGFASLIYQTTWLRQTMALFGSATSTVAAMLTIFMGGLTLGSYAAGRWARHRAAGRALAAYALAEGVIALGGVAARPIMEGFRQTRWWTDAPDVTTRWIVTFAFLVIALVPWTFAMGTTYPLFLQAARRVPRIRFAWLYAANVGGAMLGTLSAAYVFFEYWGFARTQWVGVLANLSAALLALAWLAAFRPSPEGPEPEAETLPPRAGGGGWALLLATFTIGFVSLGYEVVWTRIYTPLRGTVVYAFASLLATYLGATFLGSLLYRGMTRRGIAIGTVHCWLGPLVIASGLLPHLATTTAWLPPGWELALGLGPFCLLTGVWTPLLVEQYAAGEAERVGRVYACNGLGCLLGPLLAGFVLLPLVGSKLTLLVLTCLLVVPAWVLPAASRLWPVIPVLAAVPGFLFVPTIEERIGSPWILHDATATVAAWGRDRSRKLLVNGISMTGLVSETKWMTHLPGLVHGKPARILVVCFGMGTSFRSALAWGADVTSVELVPSVPRMFSYFHADADAVLRNPRGRIVIDDGRHFLETTRERYDLIVVDPPPPLEAAGSSMLNSREFFAAARRALAPGGLVMHWTPGGDFFTEVSLASTLADEFPHLMAFRSPGTVRGLYILASDSRVDPSRAPAELGAAPAAVRHDLQEWLRPDEVASQLARILSRRITREEILRWSPGFVRLADDFPVNEYYWVRRQASALPRLITGAAGPPPVVRRLEGFVRDEVPDSSAHARDPRFSIYLMAMAFYRYDIAAGSIRAVAARYPERLEARQLAADAQRRWEAESTPR